MTFWLERAKIKLKIISYTTDTSIEISLTACVNIKTENIVSLEGRHTLQTRVLENHGNKRFHYDVEYADPSRLQISVKILIGEKS